MPFPGPTFQQYGIPTSQASKSAFLYGNTCSQVKKIVSSLETQLVNLNLPKNTGSPLQNWKGPTDFFYRGPEDIFYRSHNPTTFPCPWPTITTTTTGLAGLFFRNYCMLRWDHTGVLTNRWDYWYEIEIFHRPDGLPVTQPAASKHKRNNGTKQVILNSITTIKESVIRR